MEISLRGISLCCFTFPVFLLFWQFLYITRQDDPVELTMKNYQPKYILIYEAPDWMKRLPLVSMDVDCVVTTDKNYFYDIRKFDAVVFSGSDDWSAENTFPQVRSPNQYYVFADLESPYYTNHKFSGNLLNEIYNLTMTYRRDSDIYWPYGFVTAQNNNYVTELEVPIWMEPDFGSKDNTVLEVIKNKKKTAAWFVSKCLVASKRQFLVAVLMQHIDVDIYGFCGTFSCSKETMNDCYQLVEKNYFFYLSLENSICKDYLTEKIFNLMNYYVVPVVYGGANYSHFLPPHSYIDANDFETVTELANYLKYLTNNPEEYAKYFWWKKYYKNVSTLKSFNNICKKLHKFTSEVKEGQFIRSYRNISSWWNDNQCMTEMKIKFV